MSPEEADRLGLKPFGDGGAENETSPCRGSAEDLFRFLFFFLILFFYDFLWFFKWFSTTFAWEVEVFWDILELLILWICCFFLGWFFFFFNLRVGFWGGKSQHFNRDLSLIFSYEDGLKPYDTISNGDNHPWPVLWGFTIAISSVILKMLRWGADRNSTPMAPADLLLLRNLWCVSAGLWYGQLHKCQHPNLDLDIPIPNRPLKPTWRQDRQDVWVNYNDLTATSLESWLIREMIPKWP